MIRVTKPAKGPPKLDEGEELVRVIEALRIADPQSGASKKCAFSFKKTIYGTSAVKSALRAAQKNKCCYCEGFFAGHSFGDVEHFRPKTCVQQDKGSVVVYPGYYWLAYTWSNLYYSCEICNRAGKRNLFPLKDPALRARCRADSLAQESPQILDPGGAVDPRDHIKFSGPTPCGVTDLGRSTIRCLGLGRGDLTQARLHRLQVLDTLKRLAELAPEGLDPNVAVERERAIEELRRAVEPGAVYSAMAQDFLAA